ncbi:unnamed protein product [Eruca vesicaria subsp. sativa]|uniref:Uncharacterized protein n=1 Tax=Eruca vesicaria subsp. sativa TaxID=29727 RepID=A0ABC8LZC3_ERUVS|nr:unnamed protein product [Eruca vesicaria subsp. sativa]
MQYLSCPNPTEAAARMQRVLSSEASGLVDATADSILAAELTPRKSLSPWERGIKSVSPVANNSLFGLRPDQIFSPIPQPPTDLGLDPYYSDAPAQVNFLSPRENSETPARLRSLIISPHMTADDAPPLNPRRPVSREETPINERQTKRQRRISTRQSRKRKQ